jgi:hypothetical protein
MGCAACTAASAGIAAIASGIRAMIPPFVTASIVAELRAKGLRIEENAVLPGDRHELVFRPGVDILLHRLGGLDLADVERVDVRILVERSGELLFLAPAAPFDATSGEILVACQRHFAALPPDVVFEVRARTRSGGERVTSFLVPHVFA